MKNILDMNFQEFLEAQNKILDLSGNDQFDVPEGLADYLQNNTGKSVALVSPTVESDTIGIYFAIWSWLKNPQLKIVLLGSSRNAAATLSNRMNSFYEFAAGGFGYVNTSDEAEKERRHIYTRFLQTLIEQKLFIDLSTLSAAVDSIQTLSVDDNWICLKADLIIGCSIESQLNSNTAVKRQMLLNRAVRFHRTLKTVRGFNRRVIHIGTPIVKDSVYGKLHSQHGYDLKSWGFKSPSDAVCKAMAAIYGSEAYEVQFKHNI